MSDWRNPSPAFVIIADDAVDQICDTEKEARSEIADLKRMGCTVKMRKFASREAAENWVDDQDAY